MPAWPPLHLGWPPQLLYFNFFLLLIKNNNLASNPVKAKFLFCQNILTDKVRIQFKRSILCFEMIVNVFVFRGCIQKTKYKYIGKHSQCVLVANKTSTLAGHLFNQLLAQKISHVQMKTHGGPLEGRRGKCIQESSNTGIPLSSVSKEYKTRGHFRPLSYVHCPYNFFRCCIFS